MNPSASTPAVPVSDSDRRRAYETATALVNARLQRSKLPALPASLKPRSMQEALLIQRQVSELLNADVAGWKAGTPVKGLATRAPIFSSLFFQNHEALDAVDYPALIIEAEIGFQFASDLAWRETPYDINEICEAIGIACAAIEIANSRLENFHEAPDWDRVADNMGNGAVIVGSGRPDWQSLDFSSMEVALDIGDISIRQIGGHPNNDPLTPLVWLVNELMDQGGIRAGQVVITGSWTGMTPAKVGDTITARFADLGEAVVSITSADNRRNMP